MLKTDTQSKLKEAIAVYNPSDPWEKAFQDAYHEHNDGWMPSFVCQSVAKAVANLKPKWLENESLFFQRANYIFAHSTAANKDKLVFVTYPLFARDIMENQEINSLLHDPITFVSLPIAHFLLREYPIQFVFDWSKLQASNPEAKFTDIGGLVIADRDVVLGDALLHFSERTETQEMQKAAASQISRDVYKIEEHIKKLSPQTEIWDKFQRRKAIVESVGVGEAGDILVRYDTGDELVYPKMNFEERFTVTKIASSSAYTISIDGRDVSIDEQNMAKVIKEKMKRSRVIQNICEEFEVDPSRIDELQIVITNLDSRYAETDKNTMKLNHSLFQRDFFENYFFVVVHEIVHWLSRIKEEEAYFNDPEEVLGFVTAMAYELENNQPVEIIWKKIYPKISWHFHDEAQARTFFDKSIQKAQQMVMSH